MLSLLNYKIIQIIPEFIVTDKVEQL